MSAVGLRGPSAASWAGSAGVWVLGSLRGPAAGDTAPTVPRDITLRYKETRRQKQQSRGDQSRAVDRVDGHLPEPEDPPGPAEAEGEGAPAPN